MKIFFTYYLISGLLVMIYARKNYDKIVEDLPIMGFFSKDVLSVIQFFTGGFQLPFIVPLKLHTYYLEWKIKRSKRRIGKQNMHIALLKGINSVLKHDNEMLDFINTEKEKKIKQVIEAFELDGKVDYLTFMFSNKKEITMTPMDFKTKKEENRAYDQIKNNCLAYRAIAIMTVGEGYERTTEGIKKDIVIIDFETKNYCHRIIYDIDTINKKLINKQIENKLPFFRECLMSI